jgi:hypothetical protein
MKCPGPGRGFFPAVVASGSARRNADWLAARERLLLLIDPAPPEASGRSVAAARAGASGVNAAVPSSRPRFCVMNTQPSFKALSGIGRMCRFGGTAGVVLIRFRGFEDRIRTLAAAGRWLRCVLPTDLGCRRSCLPRRRSYILPMPLARPSSRAPARSSRYWHHIAGGAAGVFAIRIC